jgi:CRP/FNR family nitrogen fixation transcriptional regulator
MTQTDQHGAHLGCPNHAHSGGQHPLQALDPIATISRWHSGQEICSPNRPAASWYRLIAGAARRCMIHADGRRRIVDFLLPGDFFGFTLHDEYEFAVEAVSKDTLVACYPRERVEAMADSDAKIAHAIQTMVITSMSRLQTQLLIIGRVTAQEKVGSFLLDIQSRLPTRSVDSTDGVELPMSRYDIADYLAISTETVSRSLKDLEQKGTIALSGARRVQIVDRAALTGENTHPAL